MAQITDLNVAPYYDDFNKEDNFHRVLFRPGYAIQARELTTLQSILQDQVEKHGSHFFKEGSMVIPGQVSYSRGYDSLQLASIFGGETIRPSQFYNATTPITITGKTTGVTAKVVGFAEATSTTQPILYVQYISAGTDGETERFADNENISADVGITHTTTYLAEAASATTFLTDASATGSAVSNEEGVFYVRGQFVRAPAQTLVLSRNKITESARVGFTITEELVTPETDATLTDNATGSANYAAKGAHRLKISLTLSRLDLGSTDDTDFIELMTINEGRVLAAKAQLTDYNILGDTLARRTFDESGDYTVRPFLFDARESIDNSVKGEDFVGVFTKGASTDGGDVAAENLLAIGCSPGKAYVRGYEVEKIGQTFLDLPKARDFDTFNAGVTNLELGTFIQVTNAYNTPDIGEVSGETTAYKEIKLFTDTSTRGGTGNGFQIGVARSRAFEHKTGTLGSTEAVHKLYLFDVQMFTQILLSGTPSPLLTATHSTGVKLTGNTSGATGFVKLVESRNDGGAGDNRATGAKVSLVNVSGSFIAGENIIASDSSETSGIIENSSNADLTISEVTNFLFSETRSAVMEDVDGGQNFTCDFVLTRATENDVLEIQVQMQMVLMLMIS